MRRGCLPRQSPALTPGRGGAQRSRLDDAKGSFSALPVTFSRVAWGNASRSIPRISRDHPLMTASGCIWLRSATGPGFEMRGYKRSSG